MWNKSPKLCSVRLEGTHDNNNHHNNADAAPAATVRSECPELVVRPCSNSNNNIAAAVVPPTPCRCHHVDLSEILASPETEVGQSLDLFAANSQHAALVLSVFTHTALPHAPSSGLMAKMISACAAAKCVLAMSESAKTPEPVTPATPATVSASVAAPASASRSSVPWRKRLCSESVISVSSASSSSSSSSSSDRKKKKKKEKRVLKAARKLLKKHKSLKRKD